jgi:hypothetical protein
VVTFAITHACSFLPNNTDTNAELVYFNAYVLDERQRLLLKTVKPGQAETINNCVTRLRTCFVRFTFPVETSESIGGMCYFWDPNPWKAAVLLFRPNAIYHALFSVDPRAAGGRGVLSSSEYVMYMHCVACIGRHTALLERMLVALLAMPRPMNTCAARISGSST